jgi:hypothetical protein
MFPRIPQIVAKDEEAQNGWVRRQRCVPLTHGSNSYKQSTFRETQFRAYVKGKKGILIFRLHECWPIHCAIR